MKTVFLKMIIAMLLFLICSSVVAQEGGNLNEAIKSLSENIAKLEATAVPPSMKATHRQNINEQRIDLIALLGQKKGEIESYVSAVSANLRPNQKDDLTQQINELNSQIAALKKALLGDMPSTDNAYGSLAATNRALVVDASNASNESPVADGNDGAAVAGSGGAAALLSTSLPSLAPPPASEAIVPPPSSSAAPPAPAAGSSTSTSCSVVLLAPASYSIREQQICKLVKQIARNKLGLGGLLAPIPTAGIKLEGSETLIVPIISKAKVLGDIEDTRTDKQAGTDAQAKGTTSLVVKGGTPSILSWAVENGAAVASTSGTTINFRFNPLGMIQALNKTGYFAAYQESEKDPFTKFLRKTSFGVSFDASRGDKPGVFTGNQQQVSGYSVRYEFVSDRDPRNKKYAVKWDNLVDEQQIDYTNAAVKLRAAVIEDAHCAVVAPACPAGSIVGARFKDLALQNWLDQTNAKLAALQPAAGDTESSLVPQVEDVVRKQFDALALDKLADGTKKQMISFVESLNSYLTARDALLDEIAKGKVMAFEYTNHREVNAPDTSNFNFIAEKGTVGRMDLTFNATLNMYNKRPTAPNVKRIRDFVFAGQFDAPLREISGVGQPVFSIAGRFERATGNAFALDGTLVPNTKGDVGSLQIKLLLPIKGTGIRLPFSVTFANRSELIREREVRTNFGFTFDLDRLFTNNPFFKK